MRFGDTIRHTVRMMFFEDRNDVEEWLEPLDFETFWREAAVFEPDIDTRAHCEAMIAAGIVSEAEVLSVLKSDVRRDLVARFRLPCRHPRRWKSVH